MSFVARVYLSRIRDRLFACGFHGVEIYIGVSPLVSEIILLYTPTETEDVKAAVRWGTDTSMCMYGVVSQFYHLRFGNVFWKATAHADMYSERSLNFTHRPQ